MAKKGGLGKGLDAIFYDNARGDEGGAVELSINELEPNRNQPRKSFNDEAMSELADSIAQHGVLQPLLVRPLLSGGYQIVAGERRWRASRMAGLTTVPALIRELTDSEVMQIALIENLQREDLKPLEEAQGYQALIDEHGFTQDEISKTVGKSRPAVTNALRLLNLPEDIRSMLERGELTAGHARTLLSFKDETALALGDWVFVPGIRKAILGGVNDFDAYVVKADGSVTKLPVSTGDLTDDERQIIADGCLINYYRNH